MIPHYRPAARRVLTRAERLRVPWPVAAAGNAQAIGRHCSRAPRRRKGEKLPEFVSTLSLESDTVQITVYTESRTLA